MTIFSFLCDIFKKYPWPLVSLSLLTFLSSIFELLSMATVLPLLNLVFEGSRSDTGLLNEILSRVVPEGTELSILLICIFAFTFFSQFLQYFSKVVVARVSSNLSKVMRDETMKRVMLADWSFRLRQKSGGLLDVIYSQTENVSRAVKNLGIYYSNLLILVFFLVTSIFVMWEAVICAVVAAASIWGIVQKINHLSRLEGKKRLEVGMECNNNIVESFSLDKYIKANALEGYRIDGFKKLTERLASCDFQVGVYKGILYHLNSVWGALVICLLFYFFVGIFHKPANNLMFLLLLIQRSSQKFTIIHEGRRGLNASIPSYEKLLSLLEDAEVSMERKGGEVYENINSRIELKNVSFSYVPSKVVLQNMNVSIEKNSMVALVGPSGGGKSTIVDLVLGLIQPENGKIQIDGVDLQSFNMDSWRKNIGFVPQEPVLLHDSIKNNIVFGFSTIDESRVIEAAKKAHAHDFIVQQHQGYDTVIGDRGTRLSGGQKQRVALARALYKNPHFLILDEATSALDNESEKTIQEAINALKRKVTILVVAHRLTTVAQADVIYYLKDGKIEEQGSLDELVALKGEFKKMYTL